MKACSVPRVVRKWRQIVKKVFSDLRYAVGCSAVTSGPLGRCFEGSSLSVSALHLFCSLSCCLRSKALSAAKCGPWSVLVFGSRSSTL